MLLTNTKQMDSSVTLPLCLIPDKLHLLLRASPGTRSGFVCVYCSLKSHFKYSFLSQLTDVNKIHEQYIKHSEESAICSHLHTISMPAEFYL